MKSIYLMDDIEHKIYRKLVYKVTEVTSHKDLIEDTELVEMMTYDRICNIPDFNLARHMSEFLKRIE